jgi:hypothetical protein
MNNAIVVADDESPIHHVAVDADLDADFAVVLERAAVGHAARVAGKLSSRNVALSRIAPSIAAPASLPNWPRFMMPISARSTVPPPSTTSTSPGAPQRLVDHQVVAAAHPHGQRGAEHRRAGPMVGVQVQAAGQPVMPS